MSKKKSRKRSAAAELTAGADDLPKLPGDRIDDARSLLWEVEGVCHVGCAAYQHDHENNAVYNTFRAILSLLERAQEELEGVGKVS